MGEGRMGEGRMGEEWIGSVDGEWGGWESGGRDRG